LGIKDAGSKRSFGGNSYGSFTSGGYTFTTGGYNKGYTKSSYSESGYYSQTGKSGGTSDYGYHSDVPTRAAAKPTEHKSAFTPFSGFNTPKPSAGGNKYAVGMKVRHAKFGLGTVIALKKEGTVVNVAFEGQGIKELSASLAPLVIVKD
jgi:DNA helicase-2/ATP-dependent DNA helicase PcrA